MDFVDVKYINLISSRLQKFKRVKNNLYNFRCPYCGDSSKNKSKARGYLYQVKSDFNFKCHNCGLSRSFTYFLKDQDSSIYDEYILERYRSGLTGKATVAPNPKFNFTKPIFPNKNILQDLTPISELNITHPAKQYLVKRGISEVFLKEYYYCPNFKEWTNKHKKVFENTTNDDSRIIIPLKDYDGKLFGYQGRSLDANSKLRYITVMLEDKPKIYGLDKINKNEPVYITEGPFDSTFIHNAIALCGADGDLNDFSISNCVWIYDNEPRNKQIVERVDKTIQRGDKVVIWPSNVVEKDINDMVLSGLNVQSMIECNTYSGLEAKLKFTIWKKI